MKARLLDLLACPVDRKPLELRGWEERQVPLDSEGKDRALRLGIRPPKLERRIETGVLVNPRRRIFYPILCGVPRLLTFPVDVTQRFRADHRERLSRELPDYGLPDEEPTPGERDVLRSFSSEWLNHDWDGRTYWSLTPEHMYRVMGHMLGLQNYPLNGHRVLEVGIGIGGIANHLAASSSCELVGLDLSFAVEPAQATFGRRNPFLHVLQASAFRPPFREESFDLVYSHGVLHHTFSARLAMDAVAQLPVRGGRLYVWVYSPFDEARTLKRRLLFAFEKIVRPVLWRLPARLQTLLLIPLIPLYLLHQNIFVRVGRARYGISEALHAARDRFTPRYVHRHTDEEVMGWFSELGYEAVVSITRQERPAWLPKQFWACTGVYGLRRGESACGQPSPGPVASDSDDVAAQ